MSDSAALAKKLAAQLGGDLDRILGSESSNTPAYEVAERPPTGLELRQVAGLNAGYTQPLAPGEHRFGHGSGSAAGDARTKPFTLIVSDEHQASIDTEVNGVRLDGHPVKSPTQVGKAVIDAGSARFVVAPSRPPKRRRGTGARRPEPVSLDRLPRHRIRVADYVEAATEPVRRRRRWGLRSSDEPVDHSMDPLIARLLEVRQEAVAAARSQLPDPGQLLQMATAGPDHMGDIGPEDPAFASVPIAYGDLAWQPPFDRPDRLPGPMVVTAQQHSILPSVPLTADLRNGHLGIVGDRAACLAIARQISVTLRVLSPFDSITFALLAPEQRQADWEWLDRLPNPAGGLPILFIDGMRQVGDLGMRQALSESGTGGAIIVDEHLNDIPSLCATVLDIQASGGASLLDFRRGATTTRVATPLGFSAETTEEFIARF